MDFVRFIYRSAESQIDSIFIHYLRVVHKVIQCYITMIMCFVICEACVSNAYVWSAVHNSSALKAATYCGHCDFDTRACNDIKPIRFISPKKNAADYITQQVLSRF